METKIFKKYEQSMLDTYDSTYGLYMPLMRVVGSIISAMLILETI